MIYFARKADAVKIGCSRSLVHRLATLQSASPETLRIIGTMPGSFAMERALHKRFQADHISGEWFAATPDLLGYVEANAKPFDAEQALAVDADMAALLPRLRRLLEQFGERIRAARLRRRISASVMSERVGVSRPTYRGIENGRPGVGIGHYVTALMVLGLETDLNAVATDDVLGRKLQDLELRGRVRRK